LFFEPVQIGEVIGANFFADAQKPVQLPKPMLEHLEGRIGPMTFFPLVQTHEVADDFDVGIVGRRMAQKRVGISRRGGFSADSSASSIRTRAATSTLSIYWSRRMTSDSFLPALALA
jgi:hypothetical protein